MRPILTLLLLFSLSAYGDDAGPFHFEFEEIAPGVWVGVRPDGPRFPVMGNSTFVIGATGVVVYDGGGMPAMAEQLIDKIHSLTDKPVTHVVISHWHGDHHFGAFRFAEEFDDVQFIAHEFTRDVINSTRINYVDRELGFMQTNRAEFEKIVATGFDSDGEEHSEADRNNYRRVLEDSDVIEHEYLRAKLTPPNVVFSDRYAIDLGNRKVELRFLGHANTAGDIVMWLPDERIVASGDIVVLPSPYAFNVPPQSWSKTLRALNALDYRLLVPGHGAVQSDTAYVDLLIEASDSIAAQRDTLLAAGRSNDEVAAALDFTAFEERFTHGDEYLRTYFQQWFEGPFRQAALKELSGEPMVQVPPPESVPFDDARWRIEAAESALVEHLGQPALRIKGGAAMLDDTDIVNGLVEFDMAITPERGFAGLVFRAADDRNFEHFYIRPHQSGNPDANQYTPVYGGVSAWQLYYGPGYAAPVEYSYDEWMHVRVIYAGSQAEVYIDSDVPVLRISRLKRDVQGGAIGVNSANFSAVHFANFRYTALANAYRFPPPAEAAPPAAGVIGEWQISAPFDGATLAGRSRLGSARAADHAWATLATEATGIGNIASVRELAAGADTVFARHKLTASAAGPKLLSFGYSDRARVYLNGRLIYSGDNGYQSRDYRYLGTIGMFDSVVLPLQKGDNELWIAVSEAFGGWGIMGQLSDIE